jgi:SAM-dependent methyltransferase
MSKANLRRSKDNIFIREIFKGRGIDIGGFPDPFTLTQHFFPLVGHVDIWDKINGDATYMKSVGNETYDFVVSSHTLEHLDDPFVGLQNWWRILKLNGYLVLTVPDEDLYEQGIFPSKYNHDHKNTFTIMKQDSWSVKSINVVDLILSLSPAPFINSIRLIEDGYDNDIRSFDQTKFITAESSIEIVLQKGRNYHKISSEIIKIKERYYDQFRKDWEVLKMNTSEDELFK